jgi:peptidylprolyl isomerase
VGPVSTAFSLRFQDIKVGTGAEGEPNKLWKVFYTGYRASDGVKFDSSDQHRQPVLGADGKPEMGADGKPKLGDPQPLAFPQGMGRLIPGFDQGVAGMHIGGKRRLFIPWQMAYGTRDMPGTADHPGLPSKSDLIFDVELVDVTEMPQPPAAHPAPTAAPAPARPATPPPSTSSAPATPPPSSQPAQTPPPPRQ